MICDRVAIIVSGRIAYAGALDSFHGERKEFDVTLAGLAPDFADELEARVGGGRLRGRGEHITVRVAEKEMHELVNAALAHGARVEEIVRHRQDLETLFLDAVASQAREVQP
jgi:ABC-type multidrug transport system ATPase subunit